MLAQLTQVEASFPPPAIEEVLSVDLDPDLAIVYVALREAVCSGRGDPDDWDVRETYAGGREMGLSQQTVRLFYMAALHDFAMNGKEAG